MQGWIKWMLCCAVVFGLLQMCDGKEDKLIDAGKEYVLSNLNAPSSAVFLSHASSSKCRKVLEDWGITMEDRHDVITLEVEAENGFGGRIRKNFMVFFVNGNAVDMEDATEVNKTNVKVLINNLKENYGW